MSFTPPKKTPRGQMKCNLCKTACPTRNGDWFFAGASATQQIFLCKTCEAAGKGAFKRVSINSPRP